jgi:hypothetical protein
MQRSIWIVLICLVVPAVAAPKLYAGHRPTPIFNFIIMEEAAIGDNQGSVTTSTAGVRFEYVEYAFGYQHETYSWGDKHLLPFGNGRDDPWNTFHNLYATADFSGMLNEKWGWFAGGGIGAWFEDDPTSPSIYAGGGVLYSPRPGLTWRFGAAGSYHEVSSLFLPVFDLRYVPRRLDHSEHPDPGLVVNIGLPETAVGYRFNEYITLRVSALLSGGIYELGDDSTVLDRAFVEQTDFRAGVYLTLTPDEDTSIQLSVFRAFNRQWTLYDDNANRLAGFDLEDSMGGAIRFVYTF